MSIGRRARMYLVTRRADASLERAQRRHVQSVYQTGYPVPKARARAGRRGYIALTVAALVIFIYANFFRDIPAQVGCSIVAQK